MLARIAMNFHGGIERAPLGRIIGAVAVGSGTLCCAGLYMRQNTFRNHAVCKTAMEQLEQAEAVQEYLGGGPVSTAGSLHSPK